MHIISCQSDCNLCSRYLDSYRQSSTVFILLLPLYSRQWRNVGFSRSLALRGPKMMLHFDSPLSTLNKRFAEIAHSSLPFEMLFEALDTNQQAVENLPLPSKLALLIQHCLALTHCLSNSILQYGTANFAVRRRNLQLSHQLLRKSISISHTIDTAGTVEQLNCMYYKLISASAVIHMLTNICIGYFCFDDALV